MNAPPSAHEGTRAIRVSGTTSRDLLDHVRQLKLPYWLRPQQKFFRFLRRALRDRKFMESIKELRDTVLRSTLKRDKESGGLIVAVSGVRGGEGTSAVSLMLALSLGACAHRRIAYMDGAFKEERFEALAKVFGLNRNEFSTFKGTTEVWGFHNPVQPNTYFLTTDLAVDVGLEFFSDKDLGNFIGNLREDFDITIIDMPAILKNSSNVFLAPSIDSLYVTVSAGETSRADIRKCMELLAQQDAEISGVVVNKQSGPLWSRFLWRDYFF